MEIKPDNAVWVIAHNHERYTFTEVRPGQRLVTGMPEVEQYDDEEKAKAVMESYVPGYFDDD